MILYALIIFGIAALGGLILASSVLRGKTAPWALSVLHALLGATGIVILLVAAASHNWAAQLSAALGLFVVAAIGGSYLASFHWRKIPTPKAVVIIHAGLAVTAFLILLAGFFTL